MNSDTGIKTKTEFLNPIDCLLYSLIKVGCPFLKRIKFTPNLITLTSLIFSLTGIYLFYIQKYLILGVVFLFSGYLFDCWDGYFARKYNLVTRFGDYFDHISDSIKFFAFIYVLYKLRINNKHFIKYLLIISFFALGVIVQTGCEEKIYNKTSEGESIKITKNFCPDSKMIKFTRFFGPATLNIVLSVIIVIYRK